MISNPFILYYLHGYNKYTPVRIALPFLLGVVFKLKAIPGGYSSAYLMLACAGLVVLIAGYFAMRTSYSLRWIAGFSASVSLFFLGVASVAAIDRQGYESEAFCMENPGRAILCRMESKPAAKSRLFAGNASTLAQMDSNGHWTPVKTRIMIYFKGDTLCKSLSYGDLILIPGKLDTIPGPSNPNVFNYSKYLYNRQIYHQVYLENGQWKQVTGLDANFLYLMAERCRMAFLETFKKFGIVGQDFALVSALLLGNSEYLDAEIRQEFSYAGVTHVLSVSGLHVGIVYVAADKMLFFLKRGRKTRKLHTVLTILFIWAYALVTGLSTSVTRASLMFSLVAAGNIFRRSSENYNILAVAAFLQVWINPFEITQVGFQLSYLAVLGIFAFYRPINEMVTSGRRIITWIWPLIAVSIAAQLATTPLSCSYFNMFPVYFLLANLLIVPLAGIIIYISIALLAAGTAGWTNDLLALPLKWSLQLMQGSVEMIQSWPCAVIEPIVMTELQVMLLYLAIISVFAFFILERRRWAFVFLSSCLMFSCISIIFQIKALKKKSIIVYNVPGSTAIDLISEKKAIFISDSLLINDDKKIRFQVRPNRIEERAKLSVCLDINNNDSCTGTGIWVKPPGGWFMGKNFMFLRGGVENLVPGKTIATDLVILIGRGHRNTTQLLSMINTKKVVIDSSVPSYEAVRLAAEINKTGLPCHNVGKDGAFVMKW